MITKRSFLRGSGGLLGGTLLCKYFNNFESYGKGLIESSKDFKNALFIDTSNGWFELGSWDIAEWGAPKFVRDELPTWSEYLEAVKEDWFDCNDPEDVMRIYTEYGIKPCEYGQLVDARKWFFEFESSSREFRSFAPPWRAHDYLIDLGLGPELHNTDFNINDGLLFFTDPDDIYELYLDYVLPQTSMTLTLLQKKLIELNEPTKIVMNYDS